MILSCFSLFGSGLGSKGSVCVPWSREEQQERRAGGARLGSHSPGPGAGCESLHAPLLPGQPSLLQGAQQRLPAWHPAASQPHSRLRGAAAASPVPCATWTCPEENLASCSEFTAWCGRVWSWLWLGAMGVKVTGSLLSPDLKCAAAGSVQVMAGAGGDPCVGEVALLLSSGQHHRVG